MTFLVVKKYIADWLPALRSRNYRLYFFGQGISRSINKLEKIICNQKQRE